MSYVAIILGALGVIFLFIELADKVEMFYFKGIPIMKHLIFLISLWLCVAVANMLIVIVRAESYAMLNTVTGFYVAIMWSAIAVTMFYLVGLLAQFINFMGGLSK